MSSNLAFESKSTWYEAQAERQPAGEPLSGAVEADVCIVGAGLAGLFLAKELTERYRSALIIEARRIGAGASGRHGGFCSPGWACRGPQIEERVGLVKAKALFDLSREGYQMVKDFLTTADIPCTSGILHPSTYSNADGLLRMLERMDKDFGYQLEFLETDTVKDLLDTPKYYQAWRDPKGFHFDALALCLLLGEDVRKQGVPIYEETLMKQFNQTSSGWEVTTQQGTVRCKQLVFCCGGYGGKEFAKLRTKFLPITTYIVVTRPLGKKLKQAIRTTDGISDGRRAGNYYRIVEGDRLLWGGDITAFGEVDSTRISEKMSRDLASVYPQLVDESGSIPIEYSWSGLMGYAEHMMPEIGPLEKDLWACTSFGGHGVNTAPIGARLVAEGLCSSSERWRAFAPFGFPWNGGFLGPFAVESSYRKMQLGDHWRAFRSRW